MRAIGLELQLAGVNLNVGRVDGLERGSAGIRRVHFDLVEQTAPHHFVQLEAVLEDLVALERLEVAGVEAARVAERELGELAQGIVKLHINIKNVNSKNKILILLSSFFFKFFY